MLECPRALGIWVPECPARSLRVSKCPLSAQVPECFPRALTFFPRRALRSYLSIQTALDGHWKGTPRALRGHLGTQGTWLLGFSRHLGTWALKTLRHFGTYGTWTLRHLDTWTLRHFRTCALKGYLGTQVFRHFGSRGTRGTLFSRLAKELHLSPFIQDCPIQKCFSYPILECKLCRRI